MKKGIFSVWLALTLALCVSLVLALPAGADSLPADIVFNSDGSASVEWSGTTAHSGSYSVHLVSDAGVDNGAGVALRLNPQIRFGDITIASYWYYNTLDASANPYFLFALCPTQGGGHGDVDNLVILYPESITLTQNVWSEADLTLDTANFHWGPPGDTYDGEGNLAAAQAALGDEYVYSLAPNVGTGPAGDGYVDDLTINSSTYTMEPRVINIDTSEGFNTIQAAIDDGDTASGHTINVASGTYDEQVVIDKSLTLQGAGDTTVIQPSQATADAFQLFARGTSGNDSAPIVVANTSGATVAVIDLKIDGSLVSSVPSGASMFAGILYRDTNGLIYEVTVESIGAIYGGCGMYLVGHDTPVSVEVSTCNVSGYNKNGITANFPNIAAYIHDNTVTGMGPTATTAQNGIQIGYGANGLIDTNTVSGHVWTGTYEGTNDPLNDPDADGAAGILLYHPGGTVEIASNPLSANQFGIWAVGAAGIDVHDNIITGLAHTGNAFPTGIAIWDSDMWSVDFGYTEVATTATIEDNTIDTHDYGILVRDYTAGGALPTATVTDNTFTNNDVQLADTGDTTDIELVFSSNTFDRAVAVDHPGSSPLPFIWSSIQDAIDAAVSGDTVYVASGTYNECIDLKDGVNLWGENEATTIIDGDDAGTVVTADGIGAATIFDSFTITDGNDSWGGGMHNDNGSLLTVINCTFIGNSADYGGGMSNTNGSSPTVENCTFESNSATNGGGMHNFTNCSPNVTGCDFVGNSANLWGGGMCNTTGSSPYVTDCLFLGNSTGGSGGGGGIASFSGSHPVVYECFFIGNTAPSGQGIYAGSDAATDAECNWWGDATGADHSSNPHGTGAGGQTVTDYVDFIPWYATDTTTSTTRYVEVDHPGSSTIAYSDTIQGGIDAAVNGAAFSGDTVTVAPGLYEITEPAEPDGELHDNVADIWIYKDFLTLQAENPAASLADPMNPSEASIIVTSGEADDVVNITANGVFLDGFTLTGEDEANYGIDIYDWEEIELYWACVVMNNYITGNGDGIWLEGNNHGIYDNIITGNSLGVSVAESSEGIDVFGNTFTENGRQLDNGSGTLDIEDVLDNNTFDRAVTVDHPGSSLLHTIWSYIQDGIDAAVAGDTVYVAAGTYTEAVTVPPGADLAIQGEGRDVTTWISPADDPSRMHCIQCDLSGYAGTTILDIAGFTFSVEDNAIDTGGIAILINHASDGPLYLDIHLNRFVETTTIPDETANSMLLCHNRFAARAGGEAPVKIYENLDYTAGGIAMSNTQAFDIYNNTFDGCSDALYIGYGCPEDTTVGDHHIYNNTFRNASDAYPGGPWPSIFFSYYGSGAGMTFLPSTIESNVFEDNDTAIGYYMGSDITYPADVIQFNSFDNNTQAMLVGGTFATTVNAENNWWDSANGPTHAGNTFNVGSQGEVVSDNVDYVPWFDTDMAGDSFAPVVNTNTGEGFSSIQAAIDAASGGDTVDVYPGNYSEKSITIGANSLTVQSVSGDWHDTVIDPAMGGVFELLSYGGGTGQFHEDFTLSGFTLTSGTYGIFIEGLYEDNTVNINNCLIYENTDTGIYTVDDLDGNLFIDNCVIAENGAFTGIHLVTVNGTVEITDSAIGGYWDGATNYWGNDGDGIDIGTISPSGSVLIDNCKITDNVGNGISDGTGGCYGNLTISNSIIGSYDYDTESADGDFDGNGESGIYLEYVWGTGEVTIKGNTIRDNSGSATGIDIDAADEDAVVSINFNNIEDNNGDGIYYNYGGGGFLDPINAENNWWGDASGPGGAGPGTGDEVSDYVDYTPWLGGEVVSKPVSNAALDATLEADVEVIVTGTATVTVAKYTGNPGTGFAGALGKYVDVYIDDPSGVTLLEIRLYYTNAELTAAGLPESSLRMLWWNGTAWIGCSHSGVNTTDIAGPPPAGAPYSGFMWAKVRNDTAPTLAQLVGTAFGGVGTAPGAGGGGGFGTRPDVIPTVSGLVSAPSVVLDADGIIQTGCKLKTNDDKLTIDIPNGAKLLNSEGGPLTILSVMLEPSPPPPPSAIIMAYNLGQSGATFSPAITLTFHYNPASFPEGAVEEGLYIAYWDGEEWVAQTTTLDTIAGTASCQTSHFTIFALIAPTTSPAPAAFSVSDLSITPAEVQPDEAVTIALSVANSGDTEGSYSVVLKINGVKETEKSVTLAAGASQSVSFSLTREEAASYSVNVNGLSGSFTVAVPVSADETPVGAGTPINWTLIWIIIAAVIVVGLIIFFVARRSAD